MSSWRRESDRVAYVMGVLNCTPDSFSDGANYVDAAAAVAYGMTLKEQGAALVDVGGESTRPGAEPVALELELTRVVPVVRELVAKGCAVSIDTMKPEVMRQAVNAGACMINDVSALSFDARSMDVAADCDADVCLMHMNGSPVDMQINPHYDDDVMACVIRFFEQRLESCFQRGIASNRLILDPGIGFGKRLHDNLKLIARLGELRRYFSLPILLGVSRKSFLGELTGKQVDERELATAAAVAIGAFVGADILRVHDVLSQRQAIQVGSALCSYYPNE